MAGFLDLNDSLTVDQRLGGVLLNGQTCPREDEVERSHDLVVVLNGSVVFCQHIG